MPRKLQMNQRWGKLQLFFKKFSSLTFMSSVTQCKRRTLNEAPKENILSNLRSTPCSIDHCCKAHFNLIKFFPILSYFCWWWWGWGIQASNSRVKGFPFGCYWDSIAIVDIWIGVSGLHAVKFLHKVLDTTYLSKEVKKWRSSLTTTKP